MAKGISQTNLTTKQWQILTVICDGNGKDESGEFVPVDMDELLERLAYRTTKASMQFSIRPLVKNGFIVKDYGKRRGAKRAVYVPTKMCRQVMGYEGGEPVSIIEEEDLSYLEI